MGLADGVWVRVRCGVDEGCVKIRWIKTVQVREGSAILIGDLRLMNLLK
jgi:hypothetical protein